MSVNKPNIVYSALITPDGTLLESNHVHDYRHHKDLNGETYVIDGGLDYLRTSINRERAEYITIYDTDPHDIIRKYIKWGTRGINGDQELKWITLEHMDTEHIQAILDTQPIHHWRRKIYKTELENRNGKT